MSLEISSKNDWVFVDMGERIDAFNYDTMKRQIVSAMDSADLVAVNLNGTGFLSLPTIKFLHSRATDLKKQGGQLALISPSEKIKRQFDIFASLDSVCVFASENEWEHKQEGIKSRLLIARTHNIPSVDL